MHRNARRLTRAHTPTHIHMHTHTHIHTHTRMHIALPWQVEHVVYCRLSKRQRRLYEDFMANSGTRSTLKSGNFIGMMNVLMQLRKVREGAMYMCVLSLSPSLPLSLSLWLGVVSLCALVLGMFRFYLFIFIHVYMYICMCLYAPLRTGLQPS